MFGNIIFPKHKKLPFKFLLFLFFSLLFSRSAALLNSQRNILTFRRLVSDVSTRCFSSCYRSTRCSTKFRSDPKDRSRSSESKCRRRSENSLFSHQCRSICTISNANSLEYSTNKSRSRFSNSGVRWISS